MKGRRLETFLASAAHASVIITVELLRAHRSSLWAPLTGTEWFAVFATWLAYSAIIFAVSLAVLSAARLIPRVHDYLSFGPAISVPAAAAIGLLGALAWATKWESIPALIVSIGGITTIVVTQMQFWRTYLSGTAVPSLISLAGAAAAIAAMTRHDSVRLSTEFAPISVVLIAVGTAIAAASGLELFHIFYRRLRHGDALFGVFPLLFLMLAGLGPVVVYGIAIEFPPGRAPNIVLVTVDTLRADATSLYGGEVPTPNLERIAEDAVVFDHAYTLAPWTLPSVFGMMASQYPPHLSPDGDTQEWSHEISLYRMPKSPATLAERLAEKGYVTGACISNSLLRDREGILRGFDTVRVIGHRTHTLDGPFRGMPWLQRALHRAEFPWVYEKPADTTRVCTAFAESFLREHTGKPIFLWVHYMDPHAAYAPPPQYAPKNTEWPVFCNADPYWGTPQSDEAGKLNLTPTQQADVRALYDAEVRYVDDAIGRVWDAVRATPGDTYFTLTADHGEAFWDHGEYGHGQSLFDHQVRVPLLIAGPDISARRIPEAVSQIDLIPTLAAMTNTPEDSQWQGQSWLPGLRDQSQPLTPSPVFAQATNVFSPNGPLVMTLDWPIKAIYQQSTKEFTFYDLEEDPREQSPIPSTDEQLIIRIEAHLQAHGALVSEVFERDHGDDTSRTETEEQLRSMGYLD